MLLTIKINNKSITIMIMRLIINLIFLINKKSKNERYQDNSNNSNKNKSMPDPKLSKLPLNPITKNVK